jgi:Big-like domain-containing protein/parallel beta helix pectate lyase-like protein
MLRFGRTVAVVAVLFVVLPAGAHAADCTTTVSGTSAAASAVNAAVPGATVCLADGSYGKLTIGASKAAPGVTVRAAHPGQATIAGATFTGAGITLAQFNVSNEIQLMAGTSRIVIDRNRITGGYMGVNMWTDDVAISDTAIVGNRFVGPFGEDAIRANRYHDGPDADSYGLLVEGNEFTGIRENGNHSDCLQSVWVGDHLYFRRNYLHDNRCQGFFVKDQKTPVDTVVAEDNLFVRNSAPCAAAAPGCGQPWAVHLFGPMSNLTLRRNTIWTTDGASAALRESGWTGQRVVDANVIYREWSDTSAPFGSGYAATNNVGGHAPEVSWPSSGFAVVGSPLFQNPAADDYRTNDGRGVTWAPADQQYGPGAESTPPPSDTTAPHTTITSAPALVSLDSSAAIAFAVDEDGASSQCRVDDGPWAACTSPYLVSGLRLGGHTARIRSTDAAGNVESPGASASWTVIALPTQEPPAPSQPPAADPPAENPSDDDPDAAPTVDLTSPGSGNLSGRDLKLAARAADDHGVQRVEFWIDRTRVARDSRAPYTARYDTRSLRAGSHKVTVRAYDTAGQLATDSVTVRVKTRARAHSASSNRARSA